MTTLIASLTTAAVASCAASLTATLKAARSLALTATLLIALSALPAAAHDEVPFITTPDHVTLAMLALARVGPADHLIDLGSGDGRIVITAAQRFGASGLGVEIVPDLVKRSREAAQRAGVAQRAQFVEQDLFATDLSPATVVTMYLLPDVNLQLRPSLLRLKPGTRVVSHDWDMGDWPPDARVKLDVPDKVVGREKSSQVMLWVVPAPVQGLWCGPDGQSLSLQQSYQSVRGVWRAGRDGGGRGAASEPGLDRSASDHVVTGHLDGGQLVLKSALSSELRLQWEPLRGAGLSAARLRWVQAVDRGDFQLAADPQGRCAT